jgi:hypothetical protein
VVALLLVTVAATFQVVERVEVTLVKVCRNEAWKASVSSDSARS